MNAENLKLIKIKMKNGDIDSNQDNFFMSLTELIDETVTFRPTFVITSYQRTYSWEKKQIEELILDINNMNNGSSHFTGVLYFGCPIPNVGSPIIDGQQRLTTIFLILKILFANKEFDDEMNLDITNKDHKKKYNFFKNLFEKCMFRLEINGKFFDLLHLDKLISSKVDNNLVLEYKKNISNGENIIKKFLVEKKIKHYQFMENLFERLFFLTIQCEDEESEIALFRTINSKGKHLDDIDKAKCLIINDFYKTDDEIKEFIKFWSLINKQGNKKSLKSFFNNLMKKLGSKGGKFKYVEFEKLAENNSARFKSIFGKAVNNFQWFSIPWVDVFRATHDKSPEWKKYQAMCYLNTRVLKDKFENEVIGNFEKYENGDRDCVLLFALFLFTFIVRANYRFSGAEGDKLINNFLGMDEKERKEELILLHERFVLQNKLDDILYKQKGVTDDIKNIDSKHKCVFPLFVLIWSGSKRDYFESVQRIFHANFKCLDHYIPKKMILKKTSVEQSKKKVFSNDFSEETFNSDELKRLNSFYNLSLIDKHGNSNKSCFVPDEFIIKNKENQIVGFDKKKMFTYLDDVKVKALSNLANFVLEITK